MPVCESLPWCPTRDASPPLVLAFCGSVFCRLRQCVTQSNDTTHWFSICAMWWHKKVMKSGVGTYGWSSLWQKRTNRIQKAVLLSPNKLCPKVSDKANAPSPQGIPCFACAENLGNSSRKRDNSQRGRLASRQQLPMHRKWQKCAQAWERSSPRTRVVAQQRWFANRQAPPGVCSSCPWPNRSVCLHDRAQQIQPICKRKGLTPRSSANHVRLVGRRRTIVGLIVPTMTWAEKSSRR